MWIICPTFYQKSPRQTCCTMLCKSPMSTDWSRLTRLTEWSMTVEGKWVTGREDHSVDTVAWLPIPGSVLPWTTDFAQRLLSSHHTQGKYPSVRHLENLIYSALIVFLFPLTLTSPSKLLFESSDVSISIRFYVRFHFPVHLLCCPKRIWEKDRERSSCSSARSTASSLRVFQWHSCRTSGQSEGVWTIKECRRKVIAVAESDYQCPLRILCNPRRRCWTRGSHPLNLSTPTP
jgi:hypothetical protein